MRNSDLEALERLRTDMTDKAVKTLQEILLRYYPSGTKIIVNKDYWEVTNKNEEDLKNIIGINRLSV